MSEMHDTFLEMVGEEVEKDWLDEIEFTPISQDFKNEYDPSKKTEVVETHLEELDKMIGGFVRKEMNIIAAGSGVGKTVFCINSAVKQALAGKKVLFLSMEMVKRRIYEKIVAILTGKEEYKWRLENKLAHFGKMEDKAEGARLFNSARDFAISMLEDHLKDNLVILDQKFKVEEVCKILEKADKDGYDVVYLDNFQLLDSAVIRENNSFLRIGLMSEMLREKIRTTNMALVILSQITKSQDGKIQNASIRNGQKLKDDSANVTFLYRKNEVEIEYKEDGITPKKTIVLPTYQPQMFAWVDKNRYGRAFEELTFSFNAEKQTIGDFLFVPMSEKEEEELIFDVDIGPLTEDEENSKWVDDDFNSTFDQFKS